MSEETTASPDKFAALATKVERESRFTRSLVVICTVANLSVMFYMMHEMFTSLPLANFAKHMENLGTIYAQWKGFELVGPQRVLGGTEEGSGAATTRGADAGITAETATP